MRVIKLNAALAAGMLVVGPMAFAGEATDSFSVSAEVVASCSVTAADLGFGTYDPINGGDVDGSADVSVTCSNEAPYEVGLTAASGIVGSRQMSDAGVGTLSYELYSDSGRSTAWGDTTETDTVADTGTGSAKAHTVYGRIAQGQNSAPIGNYSDTVTVTVSY